MAVNRYYVFPSDDQKEDNWLKFLSLVNQENHFKTVIAAQLTEKYGGKKISLEKDDILFREGDQALNYYELISGSLKMVTYSEEGDEFIQGIFNSGESFGEPPLFGGFNYPSAAISLGTSEVWKLPRDNFFKLLKENFEVHLAIDRVLCERLRYKNMVLSEISFYEPEHRILSLITYLKEKSDSANGKYVVPFTRQQIADMSGLRVETVIRTVKAMEEKGKLQIVDHKILI
jgi:CRP-like cAMP-binding protein